MHGIVRGLSDLSWQLTNIGWLMLMFIIVSPVLSKVAVERAAVTVQCLYILAIKNNVNITSLRTMHFGQQAGPAAPLIIDHVISQAVSLAAR